MAETAQERTEEATPRRKQKARRKGTVARSSDATNAIVIVVLLAVLPMVGANLASSLLSGMRRSLLSIPEAATPSAILSFAMDFLKPAALSIAPVIGTALLVGLAANFLQVGFALSPEAMSPNLNKINPASGLKRLFSRKSLVEGAKAMAKSGLFAFIAYSVVRSEWNNLLNLSGLPAPVAMSVVGSILQTIFVRVAIAWLVLAALDYLFQRKEVDKELRMTKQELREEMKEMEQSPELRAAMASRRRKLSKGRMMESIKTADVVVTNPTHYAVAIRYDRSSMHAPKVVAKGVDYLALRIRETAAEHKVPILPNPPLARQLYKKCEVDDYVPRELFQAVAEVLAHVYTTLRKVRLA